jgi:DNA-binding FrmR family transcriptional regulator
VPEPRENRAAIVRRLKSVEGRVRGGQCMVEDDADCIDVVDQIVAVQRAL